MLGKGFFSFFLILLCSNIGGSWWVKLNSAPLIVNLSMFLSFFCWDSVFSSFFCWDFWGVKFLKFALVLCVCDFSWDRSSDSARSVGSAEAPAGECHPSDGGWWKAGPERQGSEREDWAGSWTGKQGKLLGAGIAQWLEHWTCDQKVVGSSPGRSGGRIFFSRVNCLCWLLFRYAFHPRVTTVARKKNRSFCQKCTWQVTAKHACTLRMWLCMKWHGAWLYGVHRTRWDGNSFMRHQPCQRCKYTTSVDIQKCAIKSYSLM